MDNGMTEDIVMKMEFAIKHNSHSLATRILFHTALLEDPSIFDRMLHQTSPRAQAKIIELIAENALVLVEYAQSQEYDLDSSERVGLIYEALVKYILSDRRASKNLPLMSQWKILEYLLEQHWTLQHYKDLILQLLVEFS